MMKQLNYFIHSRIRSQLNNDRVKVIISSSGNELSTSYPATFYLCPLSKGIFIERFSYTVLIKMF